MAFTATPEDRTAEQEALDVQDFLAAIREIRRAGGWGEVSFVLTDGDISFHDVKIRRKNKRKSVVTKAP